MIKLMEESFVEFANWHSVSRTYAYECFQTRIALLSWWETFIFVFFLMNFFLFLLKNFLFYRMAFKSTKKHHVRGVWRLVVLLGIYILYFSCFLLFIFTITVFRNEYAKGQFILMYLFFWQEIINNFLMFKIAPVYKFRKINFFYLYSSTKYYQVMPLICLCFTVLFQLMLWYKGAVVLVFLYWFCLASSDWLFKAMDYMENSHLHSCLLITVVGTLMIINNFLFLSGVQMDVLGWLWQNEKILVVFNCILVVLLIFMEFKMYFYFSYIKSVKKKFFLWKITLFKSTFKWPAQFFIIPAMSWSYAHLWVLIKCISFLHMFLKVFAVLFMYHFLLFRWIMLALKKKSLTSGSYLWSSDFSKDSMLMYKRLYKTFEHLDWQLFLMMFFVSLGMTCFKVYLF